MNIKILQLMYCKYFILLVKVQSGEELKVYNLYKSMPFFFEYDCKDRGISVHI